MPQSSAQLSVAIHYVELGAKSGVSPVSRHVTVVAAHNGTARVLPRVRVLTSGSSRSDAPATAPTVYFDCSAQGGADALSVSAGVYGAGACGRLGAAAALGVLP